MILSSIFSASGNGESGSWFSDGSTGNPFGNVSQSLAGVTVTPKKAMTLSQYYACIRNISEDLAKLPIGIFAVNTANGHETFVRGDDITRVLNIQPNPDMSPMTCREVIQSHASGWGNGYAEIVRNGATGIIKQLIPIHPARVTIRRDQKTNKIVYDVFQSDVLGVRVKPQTTLKAEEMFHIKGLGGDGLYGFSVAALGADSIGVGIATQNYGATYFGNNTQLGMTLRHPKQLSKEAQQRLVDSIERNRRGSQKAWKAMVLEEGMEAVSTAIPPGDSQFIEARQFQVEDIARWFRMPLSKLQTGEGSKKSVEDENISYHTDTLMPWIVRWEQEIKIKLLGVTTKKRAKFAVSELLRGNSKAQSEVDKGQLQTGVKTINEVRRGHDANPIDPKIGDVHFMQSAMVTVDTIVKGENKVNAAKTPDLDQKNQNPAKAPGEDSAEDSDEEDDDLSASFIPMVENVASTLWNKESKARERAFKKAEKDDFDLTEWNAEFYASLRSEAFTKIEPLIASFARVVGCNKKNYSNALSELNTTLAKEYSLSPMVISGNYKGIEAEKITAILKKMENPNAS